MEMGVKLSPWFILLFFFAPLSSSFLLEFLLPSLLSFGEELKNRNCSENPRSSISLGCCI